jgi:hypothetical protein
MKFFIDRRSDRYERVPFGSEIVVEFDGLSEPIAADCVDLSKGGISLRSSLLPDEGTTVFCSFERVVEASDFGAWGRVVWVKNEGKRSSEFGVCFQNLDAEVEARISELLPQNDFSIQSTPEATPQLTTVKLLFDGSASPVEADVVDRLGDQVIFAQDLELLRLKRGLLAYESHENSYRGRIESVDLRLDGQVPQLFITVKQDPIGCEQTVEQSVEPQFCSQASESDIEQEQYGDEVQWNAGPEPVIESQPCVEREQASTQTDPPKRSDDNCTLFTLPEDRTKEERLDSDLYDERDIVSSPFATAIRCLVAIGAVLWVRLRSLLSKLIDRTNKWMREKGMHLISRASEQIQHAIFPSIQAFAQRLITLRLLRKKRRTTAAPSPLTASTGKSSRYGERGQRLRLVRPLILPVLAIGGVALAVYGFNPWTDSGRVPLHRPVQIEKADQQSVRLVDDADQQPAATQSSASSLASPAVNSRNPTAAAEFESDSNAALQLALTERAGKTLQNALSEREAQTTSNQLSSNVSTVSTNKRPVNPIGSESVETTPRKPSFGSSTKVAGHSYTLRMSNEITELRGVPDKGGFTVIIPGSLSFDRAGPIAAAHPLVARSAILNKGDHSALTVRFARGKSPAYRVTAKGSSLQITIAEKS